MTNQVTSAPDALAEAYHWPRGLVAQAPLVAALAVVGLTLGGLLIGYQPVGDDPDLMYRPIKTELAAALKRGMLPFWSDRFGLGMPLMAGQTCVGNAHKDKVKLTFSHGASLPDPDKLFNAGLEGKVWRAIDLFEGDKIDERALKNLVRAAIAYNRAKLKKATAGSRARVQKSKKAR